MAAKKSRAIRSKSNNTSSPKIQSPIRMGNDVLVRTVTTYEIGKVVSITKDAIILDNASWVAHTGRLHNAMKSGFDANAELEPYNGAVEIKQGAIVTSLNWKHGLPTDQK